jgi:GNAT superfamily N-acetyltransferase
MTASFPSFQLRFRRAREADVPTIVPLVESAYRGEASRRGWTTEADLLDGRRTDEDDVASIVADPDCRLLLAETPHQLLGSVYIRRQGHAAYLGMFAVRPTEQGQGVGRSLLTYAEDVARTEFGSARVEMTVLAQRAELISWYLRRGYRDTGKTSPFPYNALRFGIPKRPDLSFVLLEKSLA